MQGLLWPNRRLFLLRDPRKNDLKLNPLQLPSRALLTLSRKPLSEFTAWFFFNVTWNHKDWLSSLLIRSYKTMPHITVSMSWSICYTTHCNALSTANFCSSVFFFIRAILLRSDFTANAWAITQQPCKDLQRCSLWVQPLLLNSYNSLELFQHLCLFPLFSKTTTTNHFQSFPSACWAMFKLLGLLWKKVHDRIPTFLLHLWDN